MRKSTRRRKSGREKLRQINQRNRRKIQKQRQEFASSKPVVEKPVQEHKSVTPVEPVIEQFYETHRRYTYGLPETRREELDRILEEQRMLYNLGNRYCIETQLINTDNFTRVNALKKMLTHCRKTYPEIERGSRAVQVGTMGRVAQSFQDYKRNLEDGVECELPKHKSVERFRSIVVNEKEKIKVKGNWLFIEKLGWFYIRRKGKIPVQGTPCSATLVKKHGKWYASVAFKVRLPVLKDNGKVLGVDRNVGQATDSEGNIFRVPSTKKEETKAARLDRRAAKGQKGSNRRKRRYKMAGKHKTKSANIRHNHNHHVSKIIAGKAGTIVLEKLNTKGMMASAKGTAENPGKNVKAKAGLNRGIQGSNWYQLEKMIEYKAHRVLYIKPAYTSQTCYVCGHRSKKNRKSQASFVCIECGHSTNADVNAALNIRRMGLTHLHGEGRSHLRP